MTRTTTRQIVSSAVLSSCLFALLAGCSKASSESASSIPKPEATKLAKTVAPHKTPFRRSLPPKINAAVVERSDPFWQRAQREVYRSPEELVAQDARERRRGQIVPKLVRGNPHQKVLALTFDDGPHPLGTPKLLSVLKAAKVKATFFVIGKMVEKHPNLLQAIDQAGHEIGNHTFSHVTLTKIPLDDIETEYKANNDIVQRIIGKTMRFCRPPGGDYDAYAIRGAIDNGLSTVLWTDDPGDYANPGDKVILQRTLGRLSNGGIILLHDGIEETLEVLPKIISYAKAKGFRFVTVSELEKTLLVK